MLDAEYKGGFFDTDEVNEDWQPKHVLSWHACPDQQHLSTFSNWSALPRNHGFSVNVPA